MSTSAASPTREGESSSSWNAQHGGGGGVGLVVTPPTQSHRASVNGPLVTGFGSPTHVAARPQSMYLGGNGSMAAGTLQGWLFKYSMGKFNLRRNWQRRYFKATNEALQYYESDAPTQKKKGEVLWQRVIFLDPESTPDSAPNKSSCMAYFALRVLDGASELDLLMRAGSVQERDMWVQGITAILGAAPDQHPLTGRPIFRPRDPASASSAGRLRSFSSRIADVGRGMAGAAGNLSAGMDKTIRVANSRKKTRFVQDGWNLDLTYITDNIVAMGFPSEGVESFYRNFAKNVVDMLEFYHAGHYKVYNLCCERQYDAGMFGGSIEHFGFEDHNPPPLDLMHPFMRSVQHFLEADPQNVVCIHCKAGKGRTGTMIACYLVHANASSTAEEALELYGKARTQDGKGVTIPSQKRYVKYYEIMKRNWGGLPPPSREVFVHSIEFSDIPKVAGGGCTPLYHVVERNRDEPLVLNEMYSLPNELIKPIAPPARLSLPGPPVPLNGDIKFTFQHRTRMGGADKMFTFWLNTAMLPPTGRLTLTKPELDGAHKDKQHNVYPHNFTIILLYSITGEAGAQA